MRWVERGVGGTGVEDGIHQIKQDDSSLGRERDTFGEVTGERKGNSGKLKLFTKWRIRGWGLGAIKKKNTRVDFVE